MHNRHNTALAAFIVAASAFGATFQVNADCAGASVQDVKRRYANAQQLDKAGKLRDALAAYAAATEESCEPNPIAVPAAQRAAQIALPLGLEAEKNEDFEAAFMVYENGGHFAASDRALMALVRSKPDDPSAFTRARATLEYRGSAAFHANNKVQITAAGPYKADPKHLDEVKRMPAIGFERAMKAEATALTDQFLREFADQAQAGPEDLTDQAAIQRVTASQTALAQRYGNDPLKQSRDALSLVHSWSAAIPNEPGLASKMMAQRQQRLEQRVTMLTRDYARSPALLDAAIDYQMAMHIDDSAKKMKANAIRKQAAALGDQAQAQQRFLLATEYYRVARLDDKAAAAQEKAEQAAMTKMQPGLDQMRKQAEEMQKAFGDPEKIKQMQQQAQEMQKALQAQQAGSKSSGRNAAELEKELGL